MWCLVLLWNMQHSSEMPPSESSDCRRWCIPPIGVQVVCLLNIFKYFSLTMISLDSPFSHFIAENLLYAVYLFFVEHMVRRCNHLEWLQKVAQTFWKSCFCFKTVLFTLHTLTLQQIIRYLQFCCSFVEHTVRQCNHLEWLQKVVQTSRKSYLSFEIVLFHSLWSCFTVDDQLDAAAMFCHAICHAPV